MQVSGRSNPKNSTFHLKLEYKLESGVSYGMYCFHGKNCTMQLELESELESGISFGMCCFYNEN